MTASENNSKKNDIKNNIAPLFSDENNSSEEDDGEWFRDKVRALFEHFDTDQDEHLKFPELAALQKATADSQLTEEMYVMACRALDCPPNKGISLDALKLTYAAEGSDIEKDYYKVFPERDPSNNNQKGNNTNTSKEEDKDKVYEVGADGTIDIS